MADLLEPVENVVDNLDRPIWGAEAIGRAVRRTEPQTFHLLSRGLLDADKIGGRWVSTPRRLLRSLSSKSSTT